MTENRYAVLIGISHYQDQNLQTLKYPENDVDGLNEIFLSKEHGNFSETLPLKNKPSHEILLEIEQILEKATKNDLVLIYYSGHGKQDHIGRLHLATTNTQVEYLKSTSIPIESIKSYIETSKTNKVIIILDCCYSGLAGGAFLKGGIDEQLQSLSSSRGTYLMTSSTGIQVALERESESYGAFTKHIIEGIRDWKAANEDGRITIDSLYQYIYSQMKDEGFQRPMKWDLNAEGDLVIASSGKSKRSTRAEEIRAILLDLSAKKILPDSILSKAVLLISSKQENLSHEELKYDALLDRLLKNDFEINEFIEEWYKIASKQAPIPTPNEASKPRLNQKRAIDSEYAKTFTPNSLEPIQEPKQPNFQYFSKEAMVTIIIAFTSFFLITKAESIQFFINTNTNWPLIAFILTLLVAIGAGTYLYHTGELEGLRRRLQPYFSIEAIITIIIPFSLYLLITKAESIQFFINTNTNWSLIALILILLMGIGSGAYLYQTGELELLRRRLQR